MKTALTLSGSIRKGSYNRVLQQHMGRALTKAGVEVTELDLTDFPMPIFNEDLEADSVPEAAVSGLPLRPGGWPTLAHGFSRVESKDALDRGTGPRVKYFVLSCRR